MLPVSPMQVTVKPEKSCNNWFCCFKGKPEMEKEDSPVSIQTIETVTRTFETHRHSHTPPKATVPLYPGREIVALNESEKKENK